MIADHEISSITAWAVAVTAPVTGKVRLVKNVTFEIPAGGAAGVCSLAIDAAGWPAPIECFGPITVAAGTTGTSGQTVVLPAGIELQARCTGGPTALVTGQFLEELENSDATQHRHNADTGEAIATQWTVILNSPSAGSRHVIADISMWNSTAGARVCDLALEGTGPTNTIIHRSASIAAGATAHYSNVVILTPEVALAAQTDTAPGSVVVVANYAGAHDSAMDRQSPPFSASGMSLNFHSSGYLDSGDIAVSHDYDFDNEFTVAVWCKYIDSGAGTRTAFGYGNNSGTQNRIWLEHDEEEWTIHLYDHTHATLKIYRFGNTSPDTWVHAAITWSFTATALRVYINGVEDAAPAKPSDGVIDFVSTLARGSIGSNGNWGGGDQFQGLIHQASMWDVALSPTEVAAVYNDGKGDAFDCLRNQTGYSSAASCKHWWTPGRLVSPDLGDDLGITAIDYVGERVLTDTDRVAEVPS